MRGRGLRSCRKPAHLTQEQLPLSGLSRKRDPFRFLLAGIVSAWNPRTSVLHIGGREHWVAPEVSVVGVRTGVTDTVVGHADADSRRVVTQLRVH
jgi:hypothetical protein